eukprot:GHVU01017793.1.p1 GENE.GHVU01017793.1~~GHVU01017793.1.p1  ORF type:complete len:332 (-),score=40.86 GHVU01017793.1:158-1153(-)
MLRTMLTQSASRRSCGIIAKTVNVGAFHCLPGPAWLPGYYCTANRRRRRRIFSSSPSFSPPPRPFSSPLQRHDGSLTSLSVGRRIMSTAATKAPSSSSSSSSSPSSYSPSSFVDLAQTSSMVVASGFFTDSRVKRRQHNNSNHNNKSALRAAIGSSSRRRRASNGRYGYHGGFTGTTTTTTTTATTATDPNGADSSAAPVDLCRLKYVSKLAYIPLAAMVQCIVEQMPTLVTTRDGFAHAASLAIELQGMDPDEEALSGALHPRIATRPHPVLPCRRGGPQKSRVCGAESGGRRLPQLRPRGLHLPHPLSRDPNAECGRSALPSGYPNVAD